MKVIKKRFWFPTIASFIGMGIPGLLIYFFAPDIPRFYQAHWVFLSLAFIFLALPFANQKLQSDHLPHYSFFKWLSLIILFEGSLYAVFIGFARIYGRFMPILTKPRPTLVPDTMHWLLLHNGLFPWGLTALFTIALCYFSYCKKQPAYMSVLLHSVLKTSIKNNAGLMVNTIIQIAANFVLALIGACAILQFSYLLTSIHPLTITYGFQWVTIITLMIVFLLLITKKSRKLIRKMFHRFSSDTASILLIIIVSILLVGISTLIVGSTHKLMQIPAYIYNLEKEGWLTIWKLFSVSWWLMTIPLTTLFAARISNGYRLRTVMLGILLLPFILTVLDLISIHWHIDFYDYFRPLANLFTLFGSFFLIVVICHRKYFSLMLQVYFPAQGIIKHRDAYFVFKRAARNVLSILYLSLLGGMLLTGGLSFIVSFLFSLLLILVVFNLFFEVFRRKISAKFR